MVAGSTASACSYQPAFRAFALPALAPIAVRFLSEGDRLHVAMGIMMVLFGVAMSRISVLGGETLLNAIQLRLKNEALVKSLCQAQHRLEQANEDLEKRVSERTKEALDSQWALQKAVIARDDFLSIASHELRAPLSKFRLHTQLRMKFIQSDPGMLTADSLTKMFEEDDRHIRRLVELIEQMFDVSQLDSGTLALKRERVDLRSLLNEVVDRFRPEVDAAGCSIHATVGDAAVGLWDKSRMEQVLSNLLSNAVKYGRGKPIHCAVGLENGQAILTISDQGVGISAEELPRIFDKYERATAPQSVGGLGLGLYIARRIVEAHGGRISARSLLGAGSTFTVELGLASAA
jgi:signal transduction histidine kinase